MEQLAALRAQWLAQVASAIESAQKLAWQLRTRENSSAEARELYDRLEAARTELEALMGLIGKARGLEGDMFEGFCWPSPLSGTNPHTPSGRSPPPEKG